MEDEAVIPVGPSGARRTPGRLRLALALAAPALAVACGATPAPVPDLHVAGPSRGVPRPVEDPRETEQGAPLVVGAVLSLTGPNGPFGQATREGIELALAHQSTVRGRSIRLEVVDDASTPVEAARGAGDLLDRAGAVALLGGVSSPCALAGGTIASDRRVPLISVGGTASELTVGRPFMFRGAPSDARVGVAAAEHAVNRLHKQRLAVLLNTDDSYSRSVAGAFISTAQRLGVASVAVREYRAAETNFGPALRALAQTTPDVVFLPVHVGEVLAIARQLPGTGLTAPLLGGDGWHSVQLIDAAPALEGASFLTHFSADSPVPATRTFVAAFTKRHRREPDTVAALAYDSARLLVAAMARAETATPAGIREALATTRDFPGLTGPVSIGPDRETRRPFVVMQVVRGAIVYAGETL